MQICTVNLMVGCTLLRWSKIKSFYCIFLQDEACVVAVSCTSASSARSSKNSTHKFLIMCSTYKFLIMCIDMFLDGGGGGGGEGGAVSEAANSKQQNAVPSHALIAMIASCCISLFNSSAALASCDSSSS